MVLFFVRARTRIFFVMVQDATRIFFVIVHCGRCSMAATGNLWTRRWLQLGNLLAPKSVSCDARFHRRSLKSDPIGGVMEKSHTFLAKMELDSLRSDTP